MIRSCTPVLAGIALLAGMAPPALAARHPVDPHRIRAAIQEDWASRAPEGASLEIRAVPSLNADSADPDIEVVLPDDRLRPGPRAVPVALREGGRVVARGLANVVIRRQIPVWVAGRALSSGDELRAEDVREETRVYDREPTRIFRFDPQETWRVTRDVEVGAQLRAADVERVTDVEAGEEILLVARAGSATVSVTGRARQGGDVGQTILVHNPMTGALVRAVVLDSGSAELIQPGDKGERE